MAAYVIHIPDWQPATKNKLKAGRHWAVGHRLKKADAAIISAYCRLASIPPATTKRRVRLLVILAPRQRGCDPDAYDLSLLDGLQRCGALKNDNRQWCEKIPTEYARGTSRTCPGG